MKKLILFLSIFFLYVNSNAQEVILPQSASVSEVPPLRLLTGQITPKPQDKVSLHKALEQFSATNGKVTHGLMHINGGMPDTLREDLQKQGIQLITPLGSGWWIIKVINASNDLGTLTQVINWIGFLPPHLKDMRDKDLEKNRPEWAIGERGEPLYYVTFFDDVKESDAKKVIESIGGIIRETTLGSYEFTGIR